MATQGKETMLLVFAYHHTHVAVMVHRNRNVVRLGAFLLKWPHRSIFVEILVLPRVCGPRRVSVCGFTR